MKSTFAWSIALSAFALLAACGGEGSGTTGGPAPSAAAATASTTATAAASTTATASETATPSAAASATEAPSATASGTAAPSAATPASSAAATGTGTGAEPAAKKYACGDKGQPNCPMQGWMKSAMGSAVASGDGARIAKALETIASKPVAGFGNWSAMALEGAAKARAGDIDGAKQSCKKCHSAYQAKYKATMRDQPW